MAPQASDSHLSTGLGHTFESRKRLARMMMSKVAVLFSVRQSEVWHSRWLTHDMAVADGE